MIFLGSPPDYSKSKKEARTNNAATLTKAFGATWGTIATDVAKAFSAALAVVNNTDSTTIMTSATSALSLFSTVGSDLSGLFSGSGSAAQKINETAGASGPTTATAADGSFTETGSLSVNTVLSTSSISDDFVIANQGSATFSENLVATAGSWTQFSSDTAGSIVAATTLATDMSGATQQQTVFNGTTITTPSSVTAEVTFDAATSLPVIDIPWQSLPDEILVQPIADGTDQILFSAGGTTTLQPIIGFAAGGLVGDTIAISANSSGAVEFTTNIGAGDVGVITSDYSVPNTSQDFAFSGSGGTLTIDSPASFAGTISNFQPGDAIDLAGIGTATGAALSGSVLTLYESGGGSTNLNLDPTQNFSGENFLVASDGAGGTEIEAISGGYSFTGGYQTLVIPTPPTSGTPPFGAFDISDMQSTDTIEFAGVVPSNILQDESGYIGVDIAGPNNSSSFVGMTGGSSPITASIVSDGNGGSDIVAAPDEEITYTYTGSAFTAKPNDFPTNGFIAGSVSASITFDMPIGYTSTGAPGGMWSYSYYSQVGNILEPYLLDWSVTLGGNTYEFKNLNVFDSDFNFGLSFINGQISGSASFDIKSPTTGRWELTNIKPSSDETVSPSPSGNGYVGGQSTVPGIWAITSIACFLPGTHILTDRGEVLVEKLELGDKLVTLGGPTRPLRWIGKGQVLATRGRRNAATPIIVRKGALTPNVPHHDLRVTKGHSLFLDGILIPAEFLVNHRTIHWDDRAQEVTVYHLELETHDVLLANGAPAESYRDDGNRWLFQNANSAWDLPPQEPCAPVLTGGPLVDAVWRRLLDRAGPRAGVPLTNDPDLHLLVDGGRLDVAMRSGDFYIFNLPRAPSEVRIISRAASPQELGLARDPRCLGVAVRRMVVRRKAQFRTFEAADERLVEGFHAFEVDQGFRWTDGDALVPPEMFKVLVDPIEVVLHIGATAQYVEGIAASRAA
nr:Hint domain-containing protein [uncultured Rhodopila sp.]